MIHAAPRRLGGRRPALPQPSWLQKFSSTAVASRSAVPARSRLRRVLADAFHRRVLQPARERREGVGLGSARTTPDRAVRRVSPRQGRQALGYSAGRQRFMNVLRRYGSGDNWTARAVRCGRKTSQPGTNPNDHSVCAAFAPYFGGRVRSSGRWSGPTAAVTALEEVAGEVLVGVGTMGASQLSRKAAVTTASWNPTPT